MEEQPRPRRATYRALQLLGLLLAASLASFLVVTSASAQLPEEEPTETPLPDTDTIIRLEVDQSLEPLESGLEFPVRVLADNVEHMASFDFALGFDPDKAEVVRIENQGQILEGGERQDIECPDLEAGDGLVQVNCITFGPPVCLGGDAGVSGSGLLATVVFASKGKGDATIELTTSTMVLDDLAESCGPDDPVQAIPHLRGDGVTVDLAGGSESSSMALIIGIIVGVAVAVAVVGGGGYLWLRRRAPG